MTDIIISPAIDDIDQNTFNASVAEALSGVTFQNSPVINTDGRITNGSSVIGYLYRYLGIAYAQDQNGTGFSQSPTNANYYLLRNSSDIAESSNPADYSYYLTIGFGTTNFLWYLVTGGRQIQWYVGATSPGGSWVQAPTTAIDLDQITTGGAVNGTSSFPLTIYTQAPTLPSTPTGGTYTLGTYVLTPPVGWVNSFPSSITAGNFVYLSNATVVTTATTGTATPVWSAPVVAYVAAGSPGAPAVAIYTTASNIVFLANSNGVVSAGQSYDDVFSASQSGVNFTYSNTLSANSTYRITPSGSTQITYTQTGQTLTFTSLSSAVDSSLLTVLVEYKSATGVTGNQTVIVPVQKVKNAAQNTLLSIDNNEVVLPADYKGAVKSGTSVTVSIRASAAATKFAYSATGAQPNGSYRFTGITGSGVTFTDNQDGTITVTNASVDSAIVVVNTTIVDQQANTFTNAISFNVLKNYDTAPTIAVAQSNNTIVFSANGNNVVTPGQSFVDTFTVTQNGTQLTYDQSLATNSTFKIVPSGGSSITYYQSNGVITFTGLLTATLSDVLTVTVSYKDSSGYIGSQSLAVNVSKVSSASANAALTLTPALVTIFANYDNSIKPSQSVLVTGSLIANNQTFTYSASGQQGLGTWRITSVIPGSATVVDNLNGTLSVTSTSVATQNVTVSANVVDLSNNTFTVGASFSVQRVSDVAPAIVVTPTSAESFIVPGNINGLVTGYSQLVSYTASINNTQIAYSSAAVLPINTWNLSVTANPASSLTILNNNNGSFTVSGMATATNKSLAVVTITVKDSVGNSNIFTRQVGFAKVATGSPVQISFSAASGSLNSDYNGVVKSNQSASTIIGVTQFPNTFSYTTQTAPVPINSFTLSVAQNPQNLTFSTINSATVTVTGMPQNINQGQLVIRVDYTDSGGNSNFGTITFTVTKNVDNAPGIITSVTPQNITFQADPSGRVISAPVTVTFAATQNTAAMAFTSAASLTANSSWRIVSLTSNPVNALTYTNNNDGSVTITDLSVAQSAAQLIASIQTKDIAGYLATYNVPVIVSKVNTGGETVIATLSSYSVNFKANSSGVVDSQTFLITGSVTDNGVSLGYDNAGDIQPSMWRIISLDVSPTGKITVTNNNDGTFTCSSLASDIDSGYIDVTINARDALNGLRVLSPRCFVSKIKRAPIPNVTQTTTGSGAGIITIGGNDGYDTGVIKPVFQGSTSATQAQFLQNADGSYPSTPLTITGTFAVPGFVATTSVSATASFTCNSAGNVTGTISSPNADIAITFIANGTNNVSVTFLHTSNASVGASAVSRTIPIYSTNNGVTTVTVGGVIVSILQSGITQSTTYTNGQTFVRAANAGAWTPTPASNVITSVATASIYRATSLIGLIKWSMAFDVSTLTFTATEVSAGEVNPGSFTYGTIISNANQYVRPFTYTDANGSVSGLIEIDVIQGGLQGASGPANIVRFASFASGAAAAAAGSPVSATGLDANYFRSPDVLNGIYTHSTNQFVSNITAGLPYQSILQLTGNGGGSYAPGQAEIYTETITGAHVTSTVSNAAQTITVSGNTGGLTHPFGSSNLYAVVWDESNNRYLQYGTEAQSSIYGVSISGVYTDILGSTPSKVQTITKTATGFSYVSYGNSYYSANGINNWQQSTGTVPNSTFNGSKWNGLYGANSVCIVVGYGGSIIRSSNNGQSWSLINSQITNILNSIDTDGNGNWAIGVLGSIGGQYFKYLYSKDNGLTWSTGTAASQTQLSSIAQILWTGTNWCAIGDSYFAYGNNVDALNNSVSTGVLFENVLFFANNLITVAATTGVIFTCTNIGTNITTRTSGAFGSINWYATNGLGNVILVGNRYVAFTNDSINYNTLQYVQNSILISAQYATNNTGTNFSTFTSSITLTQQLSTQAAIAADFVLRWNLAAPANSITASIDASNNVILTYAYPGNVSAPSFSIMQSNANPVSSISISTPTGGLGSSASSIVYNNLQIATNRSQLQITGAPTIGAGVYTWPVSVITNAGSLFSGSATFDAQITINGSVVEFYGSISSSPATGTNVNLYAGGVIVTSGAWTQITSISFIPTNFGSAQAMLQALTTGNYLFVQGNATTSSTGTVLFRGSQDAIGQAIDIATFFNTQEVAYTSNASNNVVTLTGSNQVNLTDITHGAVSSGTNGTNVLADYALVKVQDGIPPNTIPVGTRSQITFTKAANSGAGTSVATIDYGMPVLAQTTPSGQTAPLAAIQAALNTLKYYSLLVNASTLRVIDKDPTAGGVLSFSVTNGASPTGTVAASQTVIDVGATEVVNGDANRWTFPVNSGKSVT